MPSMRILSTWMNWISAGICTVWPKLSFCAHQIAKDYNFLHVDNEVSDQTGCMPSLSDDWLNCPDFLLTWLMMINDAHPEKTRFFQMQKITMQISCAITSQLIRAFFFFGYIWARREKTGFLHMRKQRRRSAPLFHYTNSTIPLL